jgi:hypothetical protein
MDVRAIAAVSLVLLGACPAPSGGGSDDIECFVDEECGGGEVCARDDQCWPAAQVRAVKTIWTIRGQPANETTCAGFPELHIIYGSRNDDVGFAPVPCAQGEFNIDKLPTAFTRIELGIDDTSRWATTSIGSSGQVLIDLRF